MPIYEYRCSSCGHDLEVLQKLSEPVLTTCPHCRADALIKQVSAAGFHLKGSGWYATDFRNAGKPAAKADATSADAAPVDAKRDGSAAESKADTKAKADTASKADTKSAAPTASGGGCSSGCACH